MTYEDMLSHTGGLQHRETGDGLARTRILVNIRANMAKLPNIGTAFGTSTIRTGALAKFSWHDVQRGLRYSVASGEIEEHGGGYRLRLLRN